MFRTQADQGLWAGSRAAMLSLTSFLWNSAHPSQVPGQLTLWSFNLERVCLQLLAPRVALGGQAFALQWREPCRGSLCDSGVGRGFPCCVQVLPGTPHREACTWLHPSLAATPLPHCLTPPCEGRLWFRLCSPSSGAG